MMQGHGHLNDSLHGNATRVREIHGTPSALKKFVSFEELGAVEQSNAALKFG
jgi:hypothetical protein